MTAPQHPHDPDLPSLTEEEEREVTALLAGLEDRGAVTTPPEVVARLDDVLAGLVAERGGQDGESPGNRTVLPLERRPGPRRWARGLLAAAAVVVVGYGTVQMVSNGSTGVGSSDAASSAGGQSADSAKERVPGTEELGKTGDAAGDSAGGSGSGFASRGSAMSVVPTVRADHLAGDVHRVVRMFDTRTPPQTQSPSAEPSPGSAEELPDCPVPRLTDGQRLYEVRFRGRSAGLVVGVPQQGSVDVTVYACRDGGVLLSRTVPAP